MPKLSALTAVTSLDGTETVPVVQGGSTKKATVDQIVAGAGVRTYRPQLHTLSGEVNYGDGTPYYDQATVVDQTLARIWGWYFVLGPLVWFQYQIRLSTNPVIPTSGFPGSVLFVTLPVPPAGTAGYGYDIGGGNWLDQDGPGMNFRHKFIPNFNASKFVLIPNDAQLGGGTATDPPSLDIDFTGETFDFDPGSGRIAESPLQNGGQLITLADNDEMSGKGWYVKA